MERNKYIIIFSLACFALLSSITIIGQKNKQVIITTCSDTVKCEKSDDYIFNYLQIDYPDKQIEKKINIFFLFNNVIENVGSINELFNRYGSYEIQSLITMAKDSITLNCGESLSLINHTYGIEYDNNEILSIKHEWIPLNIARTTINYYNFDLMFGTFLTLDSVVKKAHQTEVLYMIRNKIEETLKYELENNKDDEEFKENLALRKVEYTQKRMRKFIITKKNDIDGMKFLFSYYYPQAVSCYKPIFDLFFSFEELKPYLTEEFKYRVFPNDK